MEIFLTTSLLLIVCALRWYVKNLYRHLFLEDISKHARVTQKWHFLICGRPNSQAHWPTRPKISVWVAKALSCDTVIFLLIFLNVNPPPPELWCWEEAGSQKLRKLVSKVFAQKKGEKCYDSYKYMFKFRWFQV